MKNHIVTLKNGKKAVIFGKLSPACSVVGCSQPAIHVCETKTIHAKSCNSALCKKHSARIGLNKFCCPEHYREWISQGDLFQLAL